MIRKFRIVGLLFIFCGLLFAFYIFCFKPCYLQVYLNEKQCYQGIDVDESAVKVVKKSLFGKPCAFTGYSVENLKDNRIRVVVDNLSYECQVNKIPIKSVVASYETEYHAGDSLDHKLIKVMGIYENGVQRFLSDYELENEAEFYDESTDITVHTKYGDAVIHLNPIPVSSFFAVYDADYVDDEDFSIDKVVAEVLFEDGLCRKVEGLTSSYQGKLKNDEISIWSDVYGETILKVYPKGVLSYIPFYEGRCYEGQELNPDLLHLSAVCKDDKYEDVLDFKIKPKRLWKAEYLNGSSDSYGSCDFVFTPVFIDTVKCMVSKDNDNYVIKNLSFIYTDSTSFDVPLNELEDVVFQNDIVSFKWKSHSFSVPYGVL